MTATPYPIPRSARQTGWLVGNGGTTYGPFGSGWSIFDIEDVVVDTRPAGGGSVTAATVTVAKTSSADYAPFTITFAAALTSDFEFRVTGARVHERALAITRGTALDGLALEKELSKQGVVMQELRRDMDGIAGGYASVEEAVAAAEAAAAAAQAVADMIDDGGVVATVNSRAAIQALDTSVWTAVNWVSVTLGGLFQRLLLADLPAGEQVAAALDAFGDQYIISTQNPLYVWRRVWPERRDILNFQSTDGSVNAAIEQLDGMDTHWALAGGAYPFGPQLFVKGSAANITGIIAAKGTGGLSIGNASGEMLEVNDNGSGFASNRPAQVSPGSSGAGSYPSFGGSAGAELNATGSTVLRVLAGLGNAFLNVVNNVANHVVLSAGAGKGLILSSDLGMQIKGIANEEWDYQAFDVASGGTVNLGQYNGIQWIRPSGGSIATATLALPSTPSDGTVIRICFRGGITSVTWTAGAGSVLGAPASVNSQTPLAFQYRGTTYGWERV